MEAFTLAQAYHSTGLRSTGLPSSVCVMYSASVPNRFVKLASIKLKFRALKTSENEIKSIPCFDFCGLSEYLFFASHNSPK